MAAANLRYLTTQDDYSENKRNRQHNRIVQKTNETDNTTELFRKQTKQTTQQNYSENK